VSNSKRRRKEEIHLKFLRISWEQKKKRLESMKVSREQWRNKSPVFGEEKIMRRGPTRNPKELASDSEKQPAEELGGLSS